MYHGSVPGEIGVCMRLYISAYTHTPILAHTSTGIGVKRGNTLKIHYTPILDSMALNNSICL